jgi:hypothetical protein
MKQTDVMVTLYDCQIRALGYVEDFIIDHPNFTTEDVLEFIRGLKKQFQADQNRYKDSI